MEIGRLSLGLTRLPSPLLGGGVDEEMELLLEDELAMDGTFDLTVPATATHLRLIMLIRSTRTMSNVDGLRMRFNDDSGDSYHSIMARLAENGTLGNPGSDGADLDHAFVGEVAASTAISGVASLVMMEIPFYRQTTWHKTWHGNTAYQVSTSAGNIQNQVFAGRWEVTTAISSIQVFSSTANDFETGSIAQLWGY